MNVSNTYGVYTWNMHLMFLHQNDGFALFGKFYLKTGMHMNFYFIAASYNYFRRSGVKLSIHYYMIAFIIA